MNIAILLATYNGSKFIEAQIESIITNDSYNLISKIVVTDDGSADNTVELVKKYKNVLFIENTSIEHGPSANFFNGLKYCKDMDYVFFCDQDDIWFNNKISVFIENIPKLNKNCPGVIYSNLELIGSEGEYIGKTFFENESIPYDWACKISNLYLQNCAPGCSMLINNKVVNRMIDTYSNEIVMHDWWALLFASLYKNVVVIPECTAGYRQHDNNAIGATKKLSLLSIPSIFTRSRNNLKSTVLQLSLFEKSLSVDELKMLSPKEIKVMRYIVSLNETTSFICRMKLVFCFSRYKSSLIRDIVTRLYFINI
ncbi:glycosyltransferase family 2 protein [Aeromonas crassostreae]